MKTTCVTFTAPGVVELISEPLPPLGRDEVLIRTRKSLISTGTELTALAADYPKGSRWEKAFKLPCRAGYANVGEVIELGENVSCLEVGDRVASESNHAEYVTFPRINVTKYLTALMIILQPFLLLVR